MNQGQFVQVPCVKCGTIVWIAPAAGMGYCPSCQTPNQIPAGGAPAAAAPGAAAPAGAPGGYGTPPPGGYGAPPGAAPGAPGVAGYGAPAPAFHAAAATGGPSKLKAIGGAVLGIVVAVGYGGLRIFGKRGIGANKGTESISALGIDPKKGDPDKMIAGAAAYAKKWKSDAQFWSVNIAALGADGTIDLTDKNVVVEYFSPSGVSSPVQSAREDSIKKFNFIGENMQYADQWGVKKQITPAPKGPGTPGCTVKMLAAALVKSGALKQGQTLQVSIDPMFSETSWIVQTPGKPSHFDTGTCAPRKD
jgi:hypothetical protein